MKNQLLPILAFLLAVATVSAQPAQDSFLVHPYLQFATQHSIYVLWETTAPATTTVYYGPARINATAPNLEHTTRLTGQRLLHEVKLDSLQAGVKYVYQVQSVTESGQKLVSPVYTFNTAVPDEEAFFFALVGDSQYNGETPWAWGKIAQRVWEDRPHFIVHVGDLVDQGTKKSDWTGHFFPNGHIAMSRYPLYTVLGNHEQDAQLYYDYMVNPAPEYYYTFHYGNAQFFMIDTNRDVSEGSEQYNWLEWELAQSNAVWKFVVHHHPPYSSEENDHGDTYIGASTYQTEARDLTPLYDAYGVDFCLFGHTHLYERSWPLFNNRVSLKDGVIYINSGGAGGGLESFDPTRAWFTQEVQEGHHYCTFAVFDRTLVFKAIDHEGRLFDTFQMTKEEDENGRSQLRQPPAPHFKIDQPVFQDSTSVRLSALKPGHSIHYTLDGSTPSLQSPRYKGPLTVEQSCTILARAYTPEGKASRISRQQVKRMEPLPATDQAPTLPGLKYLYYEGSWERLPDFTTIEPLRSGSMSTVNEAAANPWADNFALVIEGYVEVPATGTYTFYTRSDDGSALYIDGHLVVDNDGLHGIHPEEGRVILERGWHRLRITMFEATGSQFLRAGLVDDQLGRVPFHPGQLKH